MMSLYQNGKGPVATVGTPRKRRPPAARQAAGVSSPSSFLLLDEDSSAGDSFPSGLDPGFGAIETGGAFDAALMP